jgi:hypothetical protein
MLMNALGKFVEKPLTRNFRSGSTASFDPIRMTADLPRQADIVRVRRHVSNAPIAVIPARQLFDKLALISQHLRADELGSYF